MPLPHAVRKYFEPRFGRDFSAVRVHTFALHQSFSGCHDEACQEAHEALDLDSVDPMMNFRVVQAAYYARWYEAAIQSARMAIDLAPDMQWMQTALEEREPYLAAVASRRCTIHSDRAQSSPGSCVQWALNWLAHRHPCEANAFIMSVC